MEDALVRWRASNLPRGCGNVVMFAVKCLSVWLDEIQLEFQPPLDSLVPRERDKTNNQSHTPTQIAHACATRQPQ